ncbi:MAG: hypothetical protein JWQ89_4315 [Devosia sp.]|uniref:hypothetical protein n=1 Tax=Devosia sp. TaxID=1871048 RepID=UPI00262C13C2|nr:hypothetical protein [Devosia sp.]MDB5542588.1 hypothetical protein [Devosia sp.]
MTGRGTDGTQGVAGRNYFQVYRVSGRKDLHEEIAAAIEICGGRILYSSPHTRAPFYFGVQTEKDERLGLLIYPSRFGKVTTKNRPLDENRGQLRLGGEDKWDEGEVAFDVASVDTTLILGIDPARHLFIGLDPHLWNPMPLGISYYAKDSDLDAMGAAGWHAWEKDNHAGSRRDNPRSDSGLETVVAFKPNRLLDFARLERRATDLGLDSPLRLAAAKSLLNPFAANPSGSFTHVLEREFELSSREILEIIAGRSRLSVAVKGGVAEHHMQRQFEGNSDVSRVARRDRDGEPDFDVGLRDGRTFVVECKNVSPNRYADGTIKVEVQKTRASKNDPASRFYKVTEFDVVGACLFSATRTWEFRFAKSESLRRHAEFPDRLAPMQRVDETWAASIGDLN